MHTFKSILDLLGETAQVVGGCIVVREGYKNIKVGLINAGTGVFETTSEGRAYLQGLQAVAASPAEEEAPVSKPKAKAKAKPEATIEDLELD